MKQAGPASSTLSDRLSAKLEADRKEIEQLTLSEHKKLAASFLSASQTELGTMHDAIKRQSEQTLSSMRALLRWPLWTAVLCASIALASMATVSMFIWWHRGELRELRRQIASESAALTALQAQTGGVRVMQMTEGKWKWVVILPRATDLSNGQPCQDDTRICIWMEQ